MYKHLRAASYFMLALGCLVSNLFVQRQVVAQTGDELSPAVVVSVASLEEQLADIEHLVGVAGFPQFAPMVGMGVSEYIAGIDKSAPIGVMLFFEEEIEIPNFLAFVPVSDIDRVLDTISEFVDIDDDDGGFVLTTDDDEEIFVKVEGDYAFVTQTQSLLESLPSDPVSYLGGNHEKYNLAAQVFGQRISSELKEKLIELIQEEAENSFRHMDEAQASIQRTNMAQSIEQMEMFLNDTEEIVLGYGIDADEGLLFNEIRLLGAPGSDFANQSNGLVGGPTSPFTGFLDDGQALSAHFSANVVESEAERAITHLSALKENLYELLEDEVPNPEAYVDIAENLFDVFEGALTDGVFAGGFLLDIGSDGCDFASGLRVPNSSKADEALRKIADLIQEEVAEISFQFDVRTEDGIRYHDVQIAIPEDEEELYQFFGGKYELLFGVADDAVYIAGGKNRVELLNKSRTGGTDRFP